MAKNVTLPKATNYLILSHLHKAEELYKATLDYMQQNSEIVCSRPDWMSLVKNYPELGVAAMQFMVKKNLDQESKEEVKVKQPTNSLDKYYI